MDAPRKPPRRSQAWFGREGKQGFYYRSGLERADHPHDMFAARPVIGICNTWSELTPCNGHLRELAGHIKKGVYEASGFPLEFPVMAPGETQMRPTAMLFRNLASMDVEESIRANPLDGVVLLMGCDKTTRRGRWARPAWTCRPSACPADVAVGQLARATAGLGYRRDRDVGDGPRRHPGPERCRRGRSLHAALQGQLHDHGQRLDHAGMVEALGMSLPENAAIPAVDARRARLTRLSGRRIVQMVEEDLRMSQVLTTDAFANAIKVNAAIGGSANAVLHLLALAGRVGVPLRLDDWDRLGARLPCLVNFKPCGQYLNDNGARKSERRFSHTECLCTAHAAGMPANAAASSRASCNRSAPDRRAAVATPRPPSLQTALRATASAATGSRDPAAADPTADQACFGSGP